MFWFTFEICFQTAVLTEVPENSSQSEKAKLLLAQVLVVCAREIPEAKAPASKSAARKNRPAPNNARRTKRKKLRVRPGEETKRALWGLGWAGHFSLPVCEFWGS